MAGRDHVPSVHSEQSTLPVTASLQCVERGVVHRLGSLAFALALYTRIPDPAQSGSAYVLEERTTRLLHPPCASRPHKGCFSLVASLKQSALIARQQTA